MQHVLSERLFERELAIIDVVVLGANDAILGGPCDSVGSICCSFAMHSLNVNGTIVESAGLA